MRRLRSSPDDADGFHVRRGGGGGDVVVIVAGFESAPSLGRGDDRIRMAPT